MNSQLKTIIKKVAGKQAKEKEKEKELVKLIVFELDNEEYAINITDIREIINIPMITHVPNAPKFIKGIINLRGQIVVVIDLEKRFNLVRENESTPKHILITEIEDNAFGVMVDQVKEVLSLPQDSIQPSPSLVSSKIHADYISGVVVLKSKRKGKIEKEAAPKKDKTDSRLLILIDLPKILQEKELLLFGEEVDKHTKTI